MREIIIGEVKCQCTGEIHDSLVNNLASKSYGKYLILHVLLLTTGGLIGLVLAFFFQSLSLPYGWSLKKAHDLGIVSQTILAEYPKEQDVAGYTALLSFTVCCGLANWWIWARKNRASLTWLTSFDTDTDR